jgi:hypothetical protein
MTITINASPGIRSNATKLSDRAYFWIASFVVLAVVACIAWGSYYIDAPVLDGSLVGP